MIKALTLILALAGSFWLGWFLAGVDRGKELTAAYALGVQETTRMFKGVMK